VRCGVSGVLICHSSITDGTAGPITGRLWCRSASLTATARLGDYLLTILSLQCHHSHPRLSSTDPMDGTILKLSHIRQKQH